MNDAEELLKLLRSAERRRCPSFIREDPNTPDPGDTFELSEKAYTRLLELAEKMATKPEGRKPLFPSPNVSERAGERIRLKPDADPTFWANLSREEIALLERGVTIEDYDDVTEMVFIAEVPYTFPLRIFEAEKDATRGVLAVEGLPLNLERPKSDAK